MSDQRLFPISYLHYLHYLHYLQCFLIVQERVLIAIAG